MSIIEEIDEEIKSVKQECSRKGIDQSAVVISQSVLKAAKFVVRAVQPAEKPKKRRLVK